MINIYKLKLTNLQQRILRLMFVRSGSSLNQLRIAKILEVSQPAVIKAIPGLEKEDLISVNQDKESKRWSIKLNTENHKVIQLKRVDNLKQFYESGLADFLIVQFAGATVILFGSYSNGYDTVSSDIDIAVIGRKTKEVDLLTYQIPLERPININFYDSWKDIHKHLKNNILNGIIIAGSVEL